MKAKTKKLTKKQKEISNLAKKAFENKKSYREVSIQLSKQQISTISKNSGYYSTHEIEKLLKEIYVFEIPPTLRNIFAEHYSLFGGLEVNNYYLSFPYIQFYNTNNYTYISCTNKPIDENSTVYHMPLPNAGSDTVTEPICFGLFTKFKKKEKAENIIRNYFNRVFNNSHHDWIDFPKEIKNYKNWEKNSRSNPDFGTTVKWKNGIKINQLLLHISHEEF